MFPGLNVSMLVPTEEICASIWARAPSPMDIMIITDATPMMMPSIVSRLRIGLETRASRADLEATPNFMVTLSLSLCQGPLRPADIGGGGVRFDAAVAEMYLAGSVLGHLGRVGDPDDRNSLTVDVVPAAQ